MVTKVIVYSFLMEKCIALLQGKILTKPWVKIKLYRGGRIHKKVPLSLRDIFFFALRKEHNSDLT